MQPSAIKVKRVSARVGVALLATALLLGWSMAPASAAEPVQIRIGYVHVPSELGPVMFMMKQVLKNYGKTYTIDYLPFRGTGPMIPAMAAKELDLVTLAFNSFEAAINNAGLDLKIYADNFQDGVKGFYTGQWGVLENSGINSIADLKGKRFSVPAINTAVDMGMRAVMEKQGWTAGKDYHVVEVQFANTEAFLREKKIDVGFFAQAFWARAQRAGGIRQIFKMTDAFGGVTQFVLRLGRKEFMEQHRSIMVDYLEDYLLALRYVQNPKNRDEVVKAAAKFFKLPEQAINPWFIVPGKDYYRDPNGYINAEALQRNLKQMVEMGFSKKLLKVADYWDHSYLDAAVARVGRVATP